MLRYFALILFTTFNLFAQIEPAFEIARLKYGGGGDWYNDPSSEVNLLNFINDNTSVRVKPEYKFIDIATDDLFAYPFIFITGHGNIVFSRSEAEKIKLYLENGGFIYIDDDYGLDKSVRKSIKQIFPDKDFMELPFSHGIYHNVYDFDYGPPKIHEHDNKPPKGFGIFVNDRLAVYYTYESNPSDGWADSRAHNNPPEIREKALQFGTNIIVWALTN